MNRTAGRLSVIGALTVALFGCSGDKPSSPTPAVETATTKEVGIAATNESDGGVSAQAAVPKVTICHIPPGNPDNAHTITVGAPAVPAHLAHGDTLGPCPEPSPSPSPSPTPTPEPTPE